jgi:peptidoglycan/xylan/chitin deacetylase (PgdA/CDA1 family)
MDADFSKTVKKNTFTPMKPRNAAGIFARIEMQIMARLPIKPVEVKLEKPIASFSFDDIPQSAAINGAKILENHGIRGTFYVSGSHVDCEFEGVKQYSANELQMLYKNGHEIACHTYVHPRLRGRSANEINTDLDKNLEKMREILDDENFEFQSHAFPYGEFDKTSRAILAKRFVSSRGVLRGVNSGKVDFANLRTTPLEHQRYSRDYLMGFVEQALKTNGWIIFFTHDVAENCTHYGSKPEYIEQAIEVVKTMGFDIMPVNQAAKLIGNY